MEIKDIFFMKQPSDDSFPITSKRGNKAVSSNRQSYRVAVIKWVLDERDGLAEVIYDELAQLGHQPIYFKYNEPIPEGVDVVFTFAPYGSFIHIPFQLARLPVEDRPILAHWNTEGIPDPRIPWFLIRAISACRSWLDRLNNYDNPGIRALAAKLTTSWKTRMLRFRYVGDYYYAYHKGLLNVFSDSSAIYADLHNQHGLPTIVAPWGATSSWYDDLKLERDIDVLWMGKRGSRRRSGILDSVREKLRCYGIEIYMADDQENPFIFDEERTQFLNRTKITLNITRTWYDDNFSRFALAAPNRSLIVSEPVLPHCPQYKAGIHYVSAPVDRLAETILYYLQHENERLRIVENAYQLLTTTLTMSNSIKIIMEAVDKARIMAVEQG